jgi:hypothetical protein
VMALMGSACRGCDVRGRLVAFSDLDSEEESNPGGDEKTE